jgi:hypothetical protein
MMFAVTVVFYLGAVSERRKETRYSFLILESTILTK